MADKKNQGWQNIAGDSVKPPLNDLEVFKKIVDAFPHNVGICTPDGTIVYVNHASSRLYQFNLDGLIGKYNMFKDPTIDAVMPFEKIRRVLKGETVFFPDVKVPLNALSARDGVRYDMEALYFDVTYFPIMEDGRVIYIVQHQIPCRVYRGKKEIEQAKEYIDNNWFEKFDLKKVVTASCLSSAHFTRLFKQYTGITAHEYYIRIKIGKLREKLRCPDLTVTEAFTACNLDYNGYFARVFKAHTGVTPSEFKRQV